MVYHQYRKGALTGGAYVQASGQEGHKLVAHTGYAGNNHEGIHDVPAPPTQQHSYGQEYAKPAAAYYDSQAVGGTQNEYAPQAYEPFRAQQHQSAV